jgi:type III pantothenate kinase
MVSQPTSIGRAYHRAVIIGVDIGNSAAKAALIDGGTVREAGRLDTSVASTADLTEGLRILAGKAPEPPDAIVAVSVVDRWTARLEHAAAALGMTLTLATAERIPLLTALPRPDLTGPDRLLAAWAASVLHGRPVIVVDLGTATTVDAVDADGFFLGGAILPGLGLAAHALAEGTARLPRVELELPDDAIGTDTAAALQSGIVIGHLGAVREITARMRTRLASQVGRLEAGLIDPAEPGSSAPGSSTPVVVVTGGHAAAAWARAAWCRPAGPGLPAIADVLDPDLVLRGLGLLAEHLATRSGAGALP